MSSLIRTFSLLLVVLLLTVPVWAQPRVELTQSTRRESGGSAGSSMHFHYLFENERFTTPIQEVDFDQNGKGKFRFKRKDGEEIVNDLAVSPSVVNQLLSLLDAAAFLSSTEEYQHKKDFSHLGTTTFTFSRGGKDRTVRLNYTDNANISRLLELFRGIITQETRMFDLDTIRANDPLSTPAQLRQLEGELRSKYIADPQRFVPVLQEIKLDEGLPLIARNHADRLLQMIKKGK
ncbi:MAG: hypothetical protein JNJ50_24665 [Acidobacteria bacterium]|nr:hypothetical protein [Acidobacteriota bacterium]